jgi:hypothetical protein
MSWNQSEVIGAREVILKAAKDILSEALSPIEGARVIVTHSFAARLETDPDILPFVGISSETDALPLGDERKLWQTQALADLQPRIDEAQSWARKVGASYCQNLLARSASLLPWPD